MEETEKMLPIYIGMSILAQFTKQELPPFEEFISPVGPVKPKRSASEIERDFEAIIQKARETEHGEHL